MIYQPRIPVRDKKILIVEGPDGCGKTNVSQALSIEHKIPYYKMPQEKSNWMKDREKKDVFLNELMFGERRQVELLKQMKSEVVIDRGHPSEYVYSKKFNRKTDMDFLKHVDREYARMGVYVVILLRHDYSKCRKDELVSQEDYQGLHDLYMEFFDWTDCSCVALYVDAFKNDLKQEMDLLRGELVFDSPLNFTTKVVLDKLPKAVLPNTLFENDSIEEITRKLSFGKGV